MKKIFLSVVATVIMSSVAGYADNGKKLKVKHAVKKEICGKNCPETANAIRRNALINQIAFVCKNR